MGTHRVQRCGRVPLGGPPELAIAADGQAHVRGTESCGSVAACPVCSAKIRYRRALDIDAAVSAHIAAGGGVAFLTLTFPHDAGMRLGPLLNGLVKAWGKLLSGRRLGTLRERFGFVGFMRATEATHGRAGWHPHLHALVLTDHPLSLDELRELHIFVREPWIRFITGFGFRPPDIHHGVRLLPVWSQDGIGGYLSKVDPEGERHGPGNELSRADLKRGRNGSRTPFEILDDHMEFGRASDWALWEEWMTQSRGRRLMEWSRGLRALLLPDEPDEHSDEEVAAESEPATPIARIHPDVWRQLIRRGLYSSLHAAAEQDGLRGVLLLFEGNGMEVRAEEQAHGPPLLAFWHPPVSGTSWKGLRSPPSAS